MMKKITIIFIVLFCSISNAQCWQSISAGYQSTLAVKSDGTLWAWGDNDFGQLGTGNFVARNAPTQVGTDTNWKEVSCGENHAVAIKTDGTLWAWGDNFFGQLGDGGIVSMSNIPVQIGSDNDWQTISAGSFHTLALKNSGMLWAWGWNFTGQIGDGTTSDALSPVQLAVGSAFKSIGTGAYFSHAIKTDGTLWGWGDNSFGQMGDGTNTVPLFPVQIGTDTNWKSIDGGDSFALAIKTNGTLWSWGANFEGNLGDGTLIDRSFPLQVGTDTNWKSVSTKFYHVSALKTNGTLWFWGFNAYGQLGDGTAIQKTIPTQLGTSNNWKSSSAGVYHSIALDNDGTVLASGDDQFLQLGNGSGASTTSFVIIGTCVSKVQNAQCGATLTAINQQVYADLISVAQGYRFKVTDLNTNQVQIIDKALRVFQLTQLVNYAFNHSYKVEVAIKYNNMWQPYFGVPCTVTTPATATQVQSAQCGTVLTNVNDVIYANNVAFATGYKFRVTNLLSSAQEEIIRPLREIRMTNTSLTEFNTTYSVEVAIRNTDGSYLPYGPACNVTTPVFPTTQLQLSQCDVVLSNANVTILADSYVGATTYRFRFVNTGLNYTYQFDRPLRSFDLASVPGLQMGATYSVQVSIEINGVFGPYGKVCTLTMPGNSRINSEVATTTKTFQVIASPNPFDSIFRMELKTSSEEKIELKVYDMMGKLLEIKVVDPSMLSELQFGAGYSSGIYNVIVYQGESFEVLRMVKR